MAHLEAEAEAVEGTEDAKVSMENEDEDAEEGTENDEEEGAEGEDSEEVGLQRILEHLQMLTSAPRTLNSS